MIKIFQQFKSGTSLHIPDSSFMFLEDIQKGFNPIFFEMHPYNPNGHSVEVLKFEVLKGELSAEC